MRSSKAAEIAKIGLTLIAFGTAFACSAPVRSAAFGPSTTDNGTGATAPAAPSTETAPPAASGAVGAPAAGGTIDAAQPYRLAADDEISIKVINWSRFDTDTIVGPDGTISVPLLPPVNVTGLTTTDVEQALTLGWSQYIVRPAVAVSLIRKREQKDVLVYGGLMKSGTVPYQPNLDLLQAVAAMGGPSGQGDLANVTIVRGDVRTVVDISKQASAPSVPLQPGDVVYVPIIQKEVSVLGEVNKPGNVEFPVDQTESVLDALAAAGGVTDGADLPHAQITRDGITTPLDLDALLHKGDMTQNIQLAAGDRILVPLNGLKIFVAGDVLKPGFYLMKPGDRVFDALQQAGGTATDADLGKVRLIHINKDKNTAKVTPVDVGRFLTKGDLTENVVLVANDSIYVGSKKKPFTWSDALGPLSAVSLLTTTARLVGF